MASTKQKGAYYEKKSREIMESRGYKVERAMPRILWINGRPISTRHDFFGAADLLCVKKDHICLVQVKLFSEKHHGAKAGECPELRDLEAPAGSKLLHIWRKNGRTAELEEITL